MSKESDRKKFVADYTEILLNLVNAEEDNGGSLPEDDMNFVKLLEKMRKQYIVKLLPKDANGRRATYCEVCEDEELIPGDAKFTVSIKEDDKLIEKQSCEDCFYKVKDIIQV